MPWRNRVTPLGEVVAVPELGTMMGNRGVLHDARGRIRRPWQVRRWLICLLEFNRRHRSVMAPDRYTELFFLDEATALAAGHRPCFECRRGRFLAFRHAWAVGNGMGPPEALKVKRLDDRLHAERVGKGRTKRAFTATIDDLPDGVFVTLDGEPGLAHLILGGDLIAWSPGGYTGRRSRPVDESVAVLTPGSIVAAIRAGYEPEFHPSAFGA